MRLDVRSGVEDERSSLLQHAMWLPKSHGGLVMVKNNDIYFRPSLDTEQVYRVTEDGRPGVLFNGVCDWVYRGQ